MSNRQKTEGTLEEEEDEASITNTTSTRKASSANMAIAHKALREQRAVEKSLPCYLRTFVRPTVGKAQHAPNKSDLRLLKKTGRIPVGMPYCDKLIKEGRTLRDDLLGLYGDGVIGPLDCLLIDSAVFLWKQARVGRMILERQGGAFFQDGESGEVKPRSVLKSLLSIENSLSRKLITLDRRVQAAQRGKGSVKKAGVIQLLRERTKAEAEKDD